MNDFSVKKLEPSSEKILLAKITPSYYLNDILVPVDNANIGLATKVKCTFPREHLGRIKAVLVGAIDKTLYLTKTTGTPANYEYTYDEVTKEIVMQFEFTLIALPVFISAEYSMMVATGRDRITGINPMIPTLEQVLWSGVIARMPEVSTNLTDSNIGVHSLSTSTLTLANDSNKLTMYLGNNDSFCDAKISFWTALDSLQNISYTFVGVVKSLTVADSLITLSIKDFTGGLGESAEVEDNKSELFAPTNTIEADVGRPIPFIFGDASRYAEIGNVYGKEQAVFTLGYGHDIDPEKTNRATCTPYNSSIATGVNRTWVCCRVDGTRDLSTTLTNKQTDSFGNISYEVPDNSKFTLGDTLNNAANNLFIRVTQILANNRIGIKSGEFSGDPPNGTVLQTNSMPTVVISGGDSGQPNIYLAYGKHYAVTETATSGGNKLLKVVLNNNFEGDGAFATFFGGTKILDPSKHKVHYKVRPDTTNHRHGTVVKRLLESAGYSVNDASITAANSALPVNVQFQVPLDDEKTYSTYLSYINKILSSTYGAVRSNASGEIEYILLANPVTNEQRSDTEITLDSFSYNVDYEDIIYKLNAVNPCAHSMDSFFKAVVSKESNKTKALHGKDKAVEFEHYLEDISTRLEQILAIRSNRSCVYSLTTNNVDLDTLVYDDIKIKREGLINGVDNVGVKILGLTKGESAVSIDALDLI